MDKTASELLESILEHQSAIDADLKEIKKTNPEIERSLELIRQEQEKIAQLLEPES